MNSVQVRMGILESALIDVMASNPCSRPNDVAALRRMISTRRFSCAAFGSAEAAWNVFQLLLMSARARMRTGAELEQAHQLQRARGPGLRGANLSADHLVAAREFDNWDSGDVGAKPNSRSWRWRAACSQWRA